jgi:MOSC domain-containing protein YiiM
MKKDSARTNLTQVHLLHAELHDVLNAAGLNIDPGTMGENITTRGIDLMALPQGTRLHLGKSAVVQVTGLREPCSKLNWLRPGLMKASFKRDHQNRAIPNAGIMAIVIRGGWVGSGDTIEIKLPAGPYVALSPV